jgi:hypothetical protein
MIHFVVQILSAFLSFCSLSPGSHFSDAFDFVFGGHRFGVWRWWQMIMVIPFDAVVLEIVVTRWSPSGTSFIATAAVASTAIAIASTVIAIAIASTATASSTSSSTQGGRTSIIVSIPTSRKSRSCIVISFVAAAAAPVDCFLRVVV